MRPAITFLNIQLSNSRDAEKLSWTYELDIDDQTVLAKAKMANEYAEGMLTKAQEN